MTQKTNSISIAASFLHAALATAQPVVKAGPEGVAYAAERVPGPLGPMESESCLRRSPPIPDQELETDRDEQLGKECFEDEWEEIPGNDGPTQPSQSKTGNL